MDYQPGQTTFTLSTSTGNGDMISVPLDILNDTAVEGDHTFSVEVVDSDLVMPGQAATIEITDNDCEFFSICVGQIIHAITQLDMYMLIAYRTKQLNSCVFSCWSSDGVFSVHWQ